MSGPATVGSLLSATSGGWSGSPAPTFTYQWQDCNSSGRAARPIASATSARATPARGGPMSGSRSMSSGDGDQQRGFGGGVLERRRRSCAAPVAPASTSAPVVSAARRRSGACWCDDERWLESVAGADLHLSVAGLQLGAAPAAQPIAGATSVRLTRWAAADVGLTVEVPVTATNSAGSALASSARDGGGDERVRRARRRRWCRGPRRSGARCRRRTVVGTGRRRRPSPISGRTATRAAPAARRSRGATVVQLTRWAAADVGLDGRCRRDRDQQRGFGGPRPRPRS